MPLLALAKAWVNQKAEIEPVFFDKRISVGSHVVPLNGFKFYSVPAGKLRRYWTWRNSLTPFLIIGGIFKSLWLLYQLKPVVVIGAGGYVQVPVIISAWILGIPKVIHQQDIVPTFSNKLVSPLVNRITTTFEKSLKVFF